MGVSLTGHPVWKVGNSTRMNRSYPPGEAGHSQIEASPEEVNRAAFAQETGSELLEDTIGL